MGFSSPCDDALLSEIPIGPRGMYDSRLRTRGAQFRVYCLMRAQKRKARLHLSRTFVANVKRTENAQAS